MLLTAEHLLQLVEFAIEAALKAGKHIAKTRPTDIQRKAGGDNLASQVVTEVDQQSQDIILQVLEPTLAPFDLALLTEESEDDGGRLEKDYFWCIDPLDGTLPFIESAPGYSVSIALVARNGTPHIGVVYDPVEQTLYQATKGQGVFRNSKPWKIDPASPDSPLLLITDRSFAQAPNYAKTIEQLKGFGYPGLEVRLHGGGAMNACWVLENAPACYFKYPKPVASGGSSWDFAATACIFHEAGAVATDIHGNPLDLNRPDSTFMNHRGILYTTDIELACRIKELYKSLRKT